MSQEAKEDLRTVTSVSISPLFKNLLDRYKFSPTEVFRVGLAVMLCEAGEGRYKSPLNVERVEIAREKLKELQQEEELLDIQKALSIYSNLDKIKKLIGGIE